MYDLRVMVAGVCNIPAPYLDMHCLLRILTANHFPWLMKVITSSLTVASKIQNNREECMFDCEVGVRHKEKGKEGGRERKRGKEKLVNGGRNRERSKPN